MYDKNLRNLIAGHIRSEEGGDVTVKNASVHPKTVLDERADIRDILSGVVGNGFTNFSNPDSQHNFAVLSSIVGKQTAQQLMTHAFIFNQRPDVQGKSVDQRVSQFYDMGSSNPDLNNILQASRNLGQGAVPGLYQSNDILNKQATGRDNANLLNTDISQVTKLKSTANQNLSR